MRKSTLERLKDAKKKETGGPVQVDEDGLIKLLVAGHLPEAERVLNPTQRAFILDPYEVKGYMGAAGVAKTSTLCASSWLRALGIPGSNNYVSRQDYNDLMLTTGKRMQEMLDRLPKGILLDRDKSPPMRWFIQPIPQPRYLPDGSYDGLQEFNEDPSIINFMGLSDGLGSIEATSWIVDEADEAERHRVQEILSRMRGPVVSEQDRFVGLAFNPPDQTHWLYEACTGYDYQGKKLDEEAWIKLYMPQPGENTRNLPPGYHEKLLKRLPKDMADRLVRGMWGAVFPGKPVYRQFRTDIHVKSGLSKLYDPDRPLVRMWDFGYAHPAVIWAQVDWVGRLLFFREHLATEIGAKVLAQQVKALTAIYFGPDAQCVDFGDPAANQNKDTGSTLNDLNSEGIILRYQTGMAIDTGVNLIRKRLEIMIDGQPSMQYDREHCPILCRAMQGGYRMDDKGLKPFKDGFYDHPADAKRYGVTNLFHGMSGGTSRSSVNLPSSVAYNRSADKFRG